MDRTIQYQYWRYLKKNFLRSKFTAFSGTGIEPFPFEIMFGVLNSYLLLMTVKIRVPSVMTEVTQGITERKGCLILVTLSRVGST